MQWALLEEIARQELQGVGDASLGEWAERGNGVFHFRRRLTPREQRYAAIDAVVDVRRTEEFRTRVERMRPFMPPQLRELPLEQFP